MNNRSVVWDIVGWLFGIVVLAIGVINMFWGNDPVYGVFIFLLAFAFFPPVNTILKAKTGYRIHPILKILLGLFIFWTALGVGELLQDRPYDEGSKLPPMTFAENFAVRTQ